jgi:glycerophosphoryl diester phosphodiesterase
VLIFERKPSIVGHRGFGAGEPGGYRENSVASFLAAAQHGLSWVELDVRRSRDGELVLWHDPVGPDGSDIATSTANTLAAAAGIARLDEVLAALPASVGVNVDVKTSITDAIDPADRRTHALVADALRRHRDSRRFFVSSFDPAVPVYLADRKALLGDVTFGFITGAGFPPDLGIPAAANLGLDAICMQAGTLRRAPERHPHDGLDARSSIELAHAAGLEVMAWSPGPAEAVRLAQAGIDAVCVNNVPGVQAALAAAGFDSLG